VFLFFWQKYTQKPLCHCATLWNANPNDGIFMISVRKRGEKSSWMRWRDTRPDILVFSLSHSHPSTPKFHGGICHIRIYIFIASTNIRKKLNFVFTEQTLDNHHHHHLHLSGKINANIYVFLSVFLLLLQC